MPNINERLASVTGENVFTGVSENHRVELYIGHDEQNRPALKFRGHFTPDRMPGTAIIAVQQFRGQDFNTLIFSLLDSAAETVFLRFCEDIVDLTATIVDASTCYRLIRDRYLLWKRLFVNARRELLSESQILGLIGELLFLKDYVVQHYGLRDGLYSWSGPESTHKDFSCGNDWYEVKTTTNNTVKISSLEQLDSESAGTLVIYSMEKMSPQYNGIKLNELVAKVKGLLQQEAELYDAFVDLLANLGYSIRDEYDNYVYQKRELSFYTVDGDFPRIARSDVSPAIVKGTYDLDIPQLSPFKRETLFQ